jgi:RecG-like helicase
LSNIGKADASNSFFQDEIFTSRCWKEIKKSKQQKEISLLNQQTLFILQALVKITETEIKPVINKVNKILSDEKTKSQKKFETLNEFYENYPRFKKGKLKWLFEEWAKNEEALIIKNKKKENKVSWEIIGQYFQDLDNKGFISFYCNQNKINEEKLKKLINAFLDSIRGTIDNDKNYHQLPPLDMSKSFEELVPWKNEGLHFGHRNLNDYPGDKLIFRSKQK